MKYETLFGTVKLLVHQYLLSIPDESPKLIRQMKELSINIEVNDREIQNFFEKHKETNFLDKELPQVYDQIKWILFKEKQTKTIQDWVDSLKDNTKIKIKYKLLGIEK